MNPKQIRKKNNNSTFQYKYLSAYNFPVFLLHLFPDPLQKSILNFDMTKVRQNIQKYLIYSRAIRKIYNILYSMPYMLGQSFAFDNKIYTRFSTSCNRIGVQI